MANSTVLLNKVIFNALIMDNMDTAYIATLNQHGNEKILNLLKENFMPLDIRELSFKRTTIAEYLILKNTIQKQLPPENFLDSVPIVSGTTKKEEKSFAPASYFVYYFGFKPNKSLGEMKKYYELLIEAQEDFPVNSIKATQYFEDYSKKPPIRNMAGWILNSIASPSFEGIYKRLEKTKVKSDLLALSLHKRLKEPMEIKDFYSKASYNYKEENNLLRHPGKDGKYNNQDDIVLGIE